LTDAADGLSPVDDPTDGFVASSGRRRNTFCAVVKGIAIRAHASGAFLHAVPATAIAMHQYGR
jgi:hypothetical protein